MSFTPGQPILFRSIRRGVILGALPMTVVRDEPALSVTYIAPRTPAKWPVLADGRDVRSVPPEEAYALKWTVADRQWEGQGMLMVTPRGAAHSVWHFWTGAERSFAGWYVNLQAPLRRSALGYDSEDHTLDVWVERPRVWEWKDDHELEAAIKVGYYTREEGAAIRAEGQRVVERIERWDSPFCDGWERWEPEADWPIPELPADWDRL